METKIERLERLIKSEKNTLDILINEKIELEMLIKVQKDNILKKEEELEEEKNKPFINELKRMIIDNLCSDYSIEDATEQVNNSEILVEGELVRVIYDNGVSNLFKLESIKKLVLVK